MIKRLFVILVSSLWLAIPLSAQSNGVDFTEYKEGRRQSVERTGGTDGTD